MTAQITGFITRANAGLRRPRSISRQITADRGGSAVHWGGPRQGIDDHGDCLRVWRGWQNYHMDGHRWSDLAYTGGFCDHGYALAARGLGVRTAANGTDDGNQRFYAFVWLGGAGETPTAKALDALDWWLLTARKGGAGQEVRPHFDFRETSCPGGHLTRHARLRSKRTIPTPASPAPRPTPTPAPPAPAWEDPDMARLLLDPDGRTVYSVTAHRIEHVPNPEALGLLRRLNLAPPTRPEPVSYADLDALRSLFARQDAG